ncbi:hypothetical protein [Bradyrhizobium sp. AUGA SZCCT0182]|uniref:hypothetical protein n=1 Tax=Bradyrhizobium sp. AUGA SZCCT0182 TaxID=2807667 RepID=UPI001BA8BD77|nr:hypothetical protein [Bradyrhizobium sp. AUGA SZCCT0182]MBR1238429.1 hypothetical protein [Bradyrhizobium sp. AUGA SZCCT0182]
MRIEPQDAAKFDSWLATMKGPVETAAYNDAKRLLTNAWKPEWQSTLKKDVSDANELKGKIEASILNLSRRAATELDEGDRKSLDHDVVAICTAAAFERFAAARSQSPAGERTTRNEIEKLRLLATRLVKHIESLHQTSRELLDHANLQILTRSAATAADASWNAAKLIPCFSFCEQPDGRKANRPAESVTRTAAIIFKKRTGNLAGRTTDRISHVTGGPFIEWLADLFSILRIEASADAEARKYLARTTNGQN